MGPAEFHVTVTKIQPLTSTFLFSRTLNLDWQPHQFHVIGKKIDIFGCLENIARWNSGPLSSVYRDTKQFPSASSAPSVGFQWDWEPVQVEDAGQEADDRCVLFPTCHTEEKFNQIAVTLKGYFSSSFHGWNSVRKRTQKVMCIYTRTHNQRE